jgi:hypothetical protein
MDTLEQLESFFAGGVPAVKFPDGSFGGIIGGEIVADPRMQQQRDYTTGEPIVYQDGNPAMQMVVIVQTEIRESAIADDDGQRAFYIKGQMKQAVGEALRKAGEKTLRRGGKLWIKYVEDKPTTLKNGRPGNPQKIYAAKYEPPAAAAAGQFFEEPPTTGGAAISADSMRSSGNTAAGLPCPPDFNTDTWAAMNPVQQEKMYDALGMPGASPMSQAARFADEPPF